MRLPILYTMSWPERVPCSEATWPRLDFTKCSQLTFKAPDREKYPAMDLAYAAGRCAIPCPFCGLGNRSVEFDGWGKRQSLTECHCFQGAQPQNNDLATEIAYAAAAGAQLLLLPKDIVLAIPQPGNDSN